MNNSKKTNSKIRSDQKGLAFYKFVVNSVPSGVITVDHDLKITGFNPWAEKLTGYLEEEALGRFCGEVLQGGMCKTHCPLRVALTNQEPMVLVETTIQAKTGKMIPVRMNVAGLFDEKAALIGGVESFQDISALKILERERSNLISTFAHDMKSSLSIIGGFALRLLHKSDTADHLKEKKYLEVIRQESEKLETIILDFLEFARIQTGSLQLNLSATSLDKELIELCEAYKGKVEDAGLVLELQNEIDLPVINVDASKLRRVFTNLLDNAIKFSNRGGKIVMLTGKSKNEIFVKVSDQGAGISADDLPYIFDAFHRGRVGTRIEGFGLGLASVKAIIEAHGGKATVESQEGKGSDFAVFLPQSRNLE